MTKRMLIDAGHREETRVAVSDGRDLQEFDVETAVKSQLKGNIYLAKVTRVEPSLQAAFIEYGGNRHGFLAFSEIHPDYFQIPVSDREELAAEQARLVEEAKREQEEDDDGDSDAEVEADIEDVEDDEADSPEDAATSDDEADDDEAGIDGDDDVVAEDGDESEGDDDETSDDETSDDETSDDETSDDDGEAGAPARTEAADRPRSRQRRRRRSRRRGNGNEEGDERAEAAMHAAILKKGYRIQEVIKRRQILLIQVVKEERGNKGAALTTYLSIAGRYCVLMPNTPRGGGISRKIADAKQRRRLKEVATGLEVPEGMGLIIRTAGQGRTKVEIKRDFNSLLKQWEEIRSDTLQATAPSLIYEEANIIKRAIRDLYDAKTIDEVLVEGEEGYKLAKGYMKLLMPSHAARVKPYKDNTSLFHRYEVERQLDAMHSPVVQLKSGGYIVINPTEALVAIDVNSGRSTKERNIEETAVKTNVEAAIEIARQLRLRDLAGLIVIDFIDMDEHRNERTVERKLKEAVKTDRARIQIGRISGFGLMELSRQRLRPSLQEALSEPCVHCGGSGYMRSTESTVLHVLRGLEDEALKGRSAAVRVHVPTEVALYLLNQKRQALLDIEERHGLSILVERDDKLIAPDYRIEVLTPASRDADADAEDAGEAPEARREENRPSDNEEGGGRRRKRRRRRRKDRNDETEAEETETTEADGEGDGNDGDNNNGDDESGEGGRKRRRRGKRGGRRRRGRDDQATDESESDQDAAPADDESGDGDDEAAAEETRETDEQPDTSTEPEETPKPRRRRGKAKDDDEQAQPEPVAAEAEPVATEAEPDAPRADAEAEADSSDEAEPVAEGVTTTVVGNPGDDAAPEVETTEEEPKPSGPPRRGWWQKIVNPD